MGRVQTESGRVTPHPKSLVAAYLYILVTHPYILRMYHSMLFNLAEKNAHVLTEVRHTLDKKGPGN
jgi:hypothetical protein